jgi:hypothetical protein
MPQQYFFREVGYRLTRLDRFLQIPACLLGRFGVHMLVERTLMQRMLALGAVCVLTASASAQSGQAALSAQDAVSQLHPQCPSREACLHRPLSWAERSECADTAIFDFLHGAPLQSPDEPNYPYTLYMSRP